MESTKLLGISGSLRKGSFNTALLRAAVELAPANVAVDVATLEEIPPYDDDVRVRAFPEPVTDLRRRIGEADGLLIATPEYNYSVSGVLKNAIDWASRPPDQPFAAKPIAIMGASPGRLGTARAQYHLRQIFVFLDGRIVNKPEVMVGGAGSSFDDAGRLTDEPTRGFVTDLVGALVAAIEDRRILAHA